MVDVQKEIGNIALSDEDGSVSAEISPPGKRLTDEPKSKKLNVKNSNPTPEFD